MIQTVSTNDKRLQYTVVNIHTVYTNGTDSVIQFIKVNCTSINI